MPEWLKEPLLHFFVLGALVFGADHLLNTRSDDLHTIVVGAAVDSEIRRLFEASANRPPDAAELKALRERWVDNEVLYREGLALQVDRGDSAIRDRVIFKALSVVDAGTKLPPIDEATLHRWFDQHRSKYEEPARFDFQEAVLSGDTSESAARSFAAALNAGAPGDARAGLRVFKGRPLENLVQSYGAGFASALEATTIGDWTALPTAKHVWRVVRLEGTSAPQPAVFGQLRNVVLQDWTDATMAQQRTDAVRQMAKKYTVTQPAPQTGQAAAAGKVKPS